MSSPLLREYKAVIFDFDGTLVDTLEFHYLAYREVFAARGINLERDCFFRSLGGKASETIPKMAGREMAAGEIREIHRAKKACVGRFFASEEITLLSAALFVPLLKGHVPLALASSGSREGIELLLARIGWENCFSAVITGEDVVHGKPHPETYLRAAQEIATEPQKCLVFEDSDPGIEAAMRAGMKVIDVRKPLNLPAALCQKT